MLAKRSKCEFMVPGLEFLGYRIDGEGRHPTDEKTAAIKGAPSPMNVAELRSHLGLLNYCGNFIPNLSTLQQPLHELPRKGVKWAWTEECEKAFVRSKPELVADKVLVPYDEKRKLILECDASPSPLPRKEVLANRGGSPGSCIRCPEVSQVSIRSNVSPVNRSQAISDHLGSQNSSTYFSSSKNAALGRYSAGVQLSGGVSFIGRPC